MNRENERKRIMRYIMLSAIALCVLGLAGFAIAAGGAPCSCCVDCSCADCGCPAEGCTAGACGDCCDDGCCTAACCSAEAKAEDCCTEGAACCVPGAACCA